MGYEDFPHSLRFQTFDLANDIQEYCDEHGLSPAEFGRLAVGSLLGVSSRPPKKITEPQYEHLAAKWMSLYEQGWRIAHIAAKYGVAHQTVARYVRASG